MNREFWGKIVIGRLGLFLECVAGFAKICEIRTVALNSANNWDLALKISRGGTSHLHTLSSVCFFISG